MQLRRQIRGFTLVELMITVAIVAILASIAYPAYRDAITKSTRTEGKAALLDLAGNLEKCFNIHHAYNNAACPTGGASENGKYLVTIATPTTTSFTLTATPQGSQVNDSQCGTLTLTNTNIRTRSGTAPITQCW